MTTREAFGAFRAIKRWVEATDRRDDVVFDAMEFFWELLSEAERDMITSDEAKRIADRESAKRE